MAQGEFKHISVTAAEDDDIVINAGVAVPAEEPASLSDGESLSGNEPDPDLQAEEGAVKEPAPELAEEASRDPVPAVGAPSESRPGREARAAARDGYREATLEDLQGEPMSLTQRVVIIAALVCIIGALAYYFIFLR